MHYVYLLLLKNKDIYKGSTENLYARLDDHKSGRVKSTRNFLPIKLIHYECYLLKSDAQRREKYLKTTEGKRFLRQQIKDALEELDLS